MDNVDVSKQGEFQLSHRQGVNWRSIRSRSLTATITHRQQVALRTARKRSQADDCSLTNKRRTFAQTSPLGHIVWRFRTLDPSSVGGPSALVARHS